PLQPRRLSEPVSQAHHAQRARCAPGTGDTAQLPYAGDRRVRRQAHRLGLELSRLGRRAAGALHRGARGARRAHAGRARMDLLAHRAKPVPCRRMSADLCALSATQLLDAYRKQELSPVEVTRAVLERIERLNPVLNAFNLVSEHALDDA